MTSLEKLNTLSELSIGRNPKWRVQSGGDGPPTGPTSGTELFEASPRCIVFVQMREDVEFRTARITLSAPGNIGDDYFITIDDDSISSVTETYNRQSGDTVDDILTSLRDQINNNTTLNSIVTASTSDNNSDGEQDILFIKGDKIDDYYIDISTNTAFGSFELSADAIEATMRAWGMPRGEDQVPEDWAAINNGTFTADRRNLIERIDTSGLSRIYQEVEVDTSKPLDPGEPFRILNGPAVEEGEL